LEVIVADWFLDSQFVTAVILGFVVVGLVVTMLAKARVIGRKFTRLQSDVERLSWEVKQLQIAEQGRFMKELKAAETLTKYGNATPSQPANGLSSEETAK
jgi:hypothetical protein